MNHKLIFTVKKCQGEYVSTEQRSFIYLFRLDYPPFLKRIFVFIFNVFLLINTN